MMGNIGAESAFRANNVQDGMGYLDDAYTTDVNNGSISEYSFCHDGRGYGLCQWTFTTRKQALYNFALMNLTSIGDELMQTKFILHEMQIDNSGLFQYLCTTDDMYNATGRICCEYERPAVNNIEVRYSIAVQCSQEVHDEMPDYPDDDGEGCDDDWCPIEGVTDSCEVTVRVLRRGDLGRDVLIMQTGLNDMGDNCGNADGDFGQRTEAAVKEFQRNSNLPENGVFGQAEWQVMMQ